MLHWLESLCFNWWILYYLAAQCTPFPKAVTIRHCFRLFSVVGAAILIGKSRLEAWGQGNCSGLSFSLMIGVFLRKGNKLFLRYPGGSYRTCPLWHTLLYFCKRIALNLQTLLLKQLGVRQTWMQILVSPFPSCVTLGNWLKLYFLHSKMRIIVFTFV